MVLLWCVLFCVVVAALFRFVFVDGYCGTSPLDVAPLFRLPAFPCSDCRFLAMRMVIVMGMSMFLICVGVVVGVVACGLALVLVAVVEFVCCCVVLLFGVGGCVGVGGWVFEVSRVALGVWLVDVCVALAFGVCSGVGVGRVA